MSITRIATLRTTLPILTGLLLSGSVLVSGAGAAPAHHPAQGSIKSVVLTTGDVAHIYGGTFKIFINGVISNKELASTEKTAIGSGLSLASSGRVTGYDSVWISGSRTNHLSVTNAVNTALDTQLHRHSPQRWHGVSDGGWRRINEKGAQRVTLGSRP